jgi:DNA-binding NarL/FixJ family response regulator
MLRCSIDSRMGLRYENQSGADLLDAVRKVASGGIYLSLTTADLVAQTLQGGPVTLPHQRLTDRELDVFSALRAARRRHSSHTRCP